LDILSTDLVPFSKRSTSGNYYACCISDRGTTKGWVEPIKRKSDASDIIIGKCEMCYNIFGQYPRKIRMDYGGEFFNEKLQTYMREKGILPDSGPRATPEYNMRQEKSQLSLEVMANAMLISSPLTAGYWDLAWKYAQYTRDRLPTNKDNAYRTPYELWNEKKPDVSKLRPFGCIGYCAFPNKSRHKMKPKAIKAIMVGYDEIRKGYLILSMHTKRLIVSRDVTFAEAPFAEQCMERVIEGITDFTNEEDDLDVSDDDEEFFADYNEDLIGGEIQDGEGKDSEPTNQPENENPLNDHSEFNVDDLIVNEEELVPDERYLVYTETGPSINKALKGPERDKWLQALEKEWNSFIENEVYDIVPRKQAQDTRVFRTVVVLTKKFNGTNTEVLYKARCCVDGSCVDYDTNTYAPVIDSDSLKLITALSMQCNMKMSDFDVSTAYLYGRLKEPRYMEIPLGILSNIDHNKFILKLKKAVYGLPEAGNVWNSTFDARITDEVMKFKRCISAPALYYKKENDDIIFLTLHTDDGKLFSSNDDLMENTLDQLAEKFKIKRLGVSKEYLGMEQIMDNQKLLWHNKQKVMALVSEFSHEKIRPTNIPLSHSTMKEINEAKGEPLDEAHIHEFRSAIGKLNWIAGATRPDIAYAMQILSRGLSKPFTHHWKALILLLGYLKGTPNAGICFKKGNLDFNKNLLNISMYCDADLATVHEDTKSTSGIMIFINGSLIVWLSKKQPTIARSTVESEALALDLGVKMLEFIIGILDEIGIRYDKPNVYEDNMSLIYILNGFGYNRRTKHMLIKLNYLKDKVMTDYFNLHHCSTTKMLADILTKPQPRIAFLKLRGKMSVVIF
ncbi:unnamed protein product, partial [Heterosigma akashiwo]